MESSASGNSVVATWNVAWASRRSRKLVEVNELIGEMAADLLVLTEATLDVVPAGGHVAEGGKDWGYPIVSDRRKVVLWSGWPISNVADDLVEPDGRHVVATVESPGGPLRVHAVCVPWSHAHVTTGRRDRRVWDEHLDFLDGLDGLMSREAGDSRFRHLPTLVAGDINQRSEGRYLPPARVRDRWTSLLARHSLTTATDPAVIDQIAISKGLDSSDAKVWPAKGLSDHSAVSCTVRPT